MKKRRVPLLILVLAILGFSYLLAPIVIVVLAGLNSGDFLSLFSKRMPSIFAEKNHRYQERVRQGTQLKPPSDKRQIQSELF